MSKITAPDDLTAVLDQFREGERAAPRTAMRQLIAAIEAVSELADSWNAKAKQIGGQLSLEDCDGAVAGFKMIGYQTHRNHATALREVISRALTGEVPDAAGPP